MKTFLQGIFPGVFLLIFFNYILTRGRIIILPLAGALRLYRVICAAIFCRIVK